MKILTLAIITALISIDVYTQSYTSPHEDGLQISMYVDAKNAVLGSEVNPPGIDLIIRPYYRINKLEVGVVYETFPTIGFESIGLMAGYVKNLGKYKKHQKEIATWIEFGDIHNKTKTVSYKAINIEYRIEIKRFYVSALLQVKERRELSNDKNPVTSIYGGAGYQITRD